MSVSVFSETQFGPVKDRRQHRSDTAHMIGCYFVTTLVIGQPPTNKRICYGIYKFIIILIALHEIL